MQKGNGNVTDAEHCCKKECHLGQCGPCDGVTKIKCRCGLSTKVNFHLQYMYYGVKVIRISKQHVF